MALKLFYTSINGFLPRLLSRSSINVTFRPIYEKPEISQRNFLKQLLKALLNKLRGSSINAVN